MPNPLETLLLGGAAAGCGHDTFDRDPVVEVELLQRLRAEYDERHQFEPGDVVELKPGLKWTHRPAYGQPCVVVERINPPLVCNEGSTGSPHFGTTLDVRLGVRDADGDFVVYPYDSRRLRPYQPRPAAPHEVAS
jgi:hypothetical protein